MFQFVCLAFCATLIRVDSIAQVHKICCKVCPIRIITPIIRAILLISAAQLCIYQTFENEPQHLRLKMPYAFRPVYVLVQATALYAVTKTTIVLAAHVKLASAGTLFIGHNLCFCVHDGGGWFTSS